MAFVFKAPRKDNRSQTADIVGPGAYIDLFPPQTNIQKNLRPFNSTSIKGVNLEVKVKEQLPGPGYYNVQSNNHEKVVISSPDEEIKVIEIPKPSSFFKNRQHRFQNEDKIEVPGPGAYEIEKANRRKVKGGIKLQGKPKSVIDHLMQINRYSSIPSIPGKQQQYGYTENENNQLELNQLNNSMADADKKLGPGCYDVKGTFDKPSRIRGVSWHNQNLNKTGISEKLDTSCYVGPGSYETNYFSQGPLYKLKQSHVFSSKSNRDQRRGERANSFLSSKNKSIMSTSYQVQNDSEPDDSDSEFEYIEDATPGPGYYHNESTMSSIKTVGKPEKFQYFGTRSERFKQVKNEIIVGPGQYNPIMVEKLGKVENVAIQNKTVPFGSSNTRFETKIFQEIKPCPGQYEPRNTFEDRLIYRIQRGYRGNFGSTERRFKNQSFQQEEIPGPGQYLDPIIEKENEDVKPNSIFISKTKRDGLAEKKKVVPPPGQYNIDAYDIKKKVQKDDEDDPELAVKKPGFLSGEVRFKEPKVVKKDDDDDFDDGVPITSNKHISDLYKKKPKQVAPFGSKQKRFIASKQNSKVAPGQYYDQLQQSWNKRTFNILFAEI
ncbi:sperm-tail PG-rich repeat protein (macronuclear) [Tetrahymena thermophila SB210]|uniref:Sperm-tail PG-rich repeat protein n=1 Tax=Tetrahymena thermophila (strain SB210) TaxID=312017 RepID=I7LT25_TETTS|nr:sperm-tail PG-rich repeat protein [Tetrahymena thermophila SB210]EAR84117.1 sperm-tail PG-rich repeat protein [Tetrahymena thermophila SB210]|eukprot:XP_001031780.1 sperm-tail PG-rich repeat protein [Tetrahymena thermophila SB210]